MESLVAYQLSHHAVDPENKDKRRLNKTRRRIKRVLGRREKEQRRQDAFGGPMAAEQRGRQAAFGIERPAAGRGPIRWEVRADPGGREGDYGRYNLQSLHNDAILCTDRVVRKASSYLRLSDAIRVA
eukprot:3296982-Pleurochrysis_carterae.AAC.1